MLTRTVPRCFPWTCVTFKPDDAKVYVRALKYIQHSVCMLLVNGTPRTLRC